MLYFLFYSRKLQKKYVRRLNEVKKYNYEKKQDEALKAIESESAHAAAQAKMLKAISGASVFCSTEETYYPLGERMWKDMLTDLEKAEKFIFMEYFIIEEGTFWNSMHLH